MHRTESLGRYIHFHSDFFLKRVSEAKHFTVCNCCHAVKYHSGIFIKTRGRPFALHEIAEDGTDCKVKRQDEVILEVVAGRVREFPRPKPAQVCPANTIRILVQAFETQTTNS